MKTDRPNQLDDLWTDWEKKTLEQKQKLLWKAVDRMPKVLFSRQDHDNLSHKALEVAKALNLEPTGKTLITPSQKWLEAHNPDYARARRARIRAEKFGEPFPPELDPWHPRTSQVQERMRSQKNLKLK